MRGMLLSLLLLPLCLFAQPISVPLTPNETVSVAGDLADGRTMPDLSWAWSSQNACFVNTQAAKFSGHHLLYTVELPPRAVLTITLMPTNSGDNLSLYAYSVGQGSARVVPDLPSCVSCEADFHNDYLVSDGPERRVELRAVNNPYTVYVGVAGAHGLTAGAFELRLELEGGEVEPAVEAVPPKVYRAPSEKGATLAYQGDLAEGHPLSDLSWAWSSQNACFVQPRRAKFAGSHILFVTELPAYSEMTITLQPENPEHDLSLYAYSLGSLRLVPDLDRCVSCEADFQSDYGADTPDREVSLRAVNNPYTVVIGVAGAGNLREGRFLLKLTVE